MPVLPDPLPEGQSVYEAVSDPDAYAMARGVTGWTDADDAERFVARVWQRGDEARMSSFNYSAKAVKAAKKLKKYGAEAVLVRAAGGGEYDPATGGISEQGEEEYSRSVVLENPNVKTVGATSVLAGDMVANLDVPGLPLCRKSVTRSGFLAAAANAFEVGRGEVS